ncbi:peptide transporter [Luteibacter rhizovicinus DSM 16549]|uniref:Peptide transporter n=1 Tax=Luteibacter rhizovicinus DSM 16549 TaxID=1440763 RepID=A0A0G9HCC9_9GAMM|nr:ShlB/FhaC/HecB family hemolysin secretion/activation protein [Luteibacter rhizovicinus]APG04834.1 peptide transporter [Luteibacter rhizovicinus DSM 16549]KLD67420.1 peptide transporter [Luteibacter rhizovicinus DSM 16549]KLD75135.1 peptide transporter [Xanthomonas hyacinthi DSM 19077]
MIVNIKWLPLMLLGLCQGAVAQQTQSIPGAGSQLRQIAPAPSLPRTTPAMRIEQVSPTQLPGTGTAKVEVRALNLTGVAIFPVEELISASGFTPGAMLGLADLQVMATRITEHYHQHGYFVARAYLPAQTIVGNAVTIAVSEGRYGNITLHNQSDLNDGLANSLLGGLTTGDPIAVDPLETRLLLLSDLPGVNVSSTLVPSPTAGLSDLLVDVTPGQRITGEVDADNGGNPYTGNIRVGGTVNANNLLGYGDVASLRLLTSGHGLRYGRASYQLEVGRATIGVAYSDLRYELGKQFSGLHANGDAQVATLYGSLPLIRSRNSNLYVALAYDHRTYEDRIELFSSVAKRNADVLTASLYGNRQDSFWGGGNNAFYLAVSHGLLDIQTPWARAADVAGARTDGAYEKVWLNVSRLQHVTDTFSLYGSATAQWASKNLDPYEQLILGGMDGIRAYPQGEAYGDEGYLLYLEGRLLLTGLSARVPGDVHLLGFVDNGGVTVSRNPWNDTSNHRHLSSVGIGLDWTEQGNFSLRTYYAWKLGNESAVSAPDKSGRFWIQAIKYF